MSAKSPCRHVGRETTAVTHFLDEEGNEVPETWRFARWDRRVWVEFAEWAKGFLPNPQRETLKLIDELVLKDAEIHRRLQIADHDELQRVQAVNNAENARVAKVNEHEKAEAEKHKRQAKLIEPKLTPFIPMHGTYVDMSETLTKKALDKACSYLSFDSPEINSLLRSIPGSAQIFYLTLKPHQPDMTEDLACEILMELGNEEVERVFATIRGQTKGKAKNPQAPAA